MNDNSTLNSALAIIPDMTMEEYEMHIVRHFLNKYGHVVRAAEKLNIGKSTIYRMLKEHPEFFRFKK